MLLYELAIVLDERSTDLIDAAAQLGLGELQTATDLDPQQTAALRAHFARPAPPPLAPLGAAPAAPPPPPSPYAPAAPPPVSGSNPGPLGAGALLGAPASPPAGPSGPTAPASWGPPTPPTSWGPPTAAVPPPPGAPAHPGPSFAYPEAASVQGPGSPLGPPPPPPGAPAPVAPGGSSGSGIGQKVLIGGVVAAVLALFAFMAINTGPDADREEAIAASEAELEAELTTRATLPATTVPPTPVTTEPPAAPSVNEPVDVGRFCQGGMAIMPFELRLSAAIVDENFAELSSLVRDRRASWAQDVATMKSGAAPILVNDIERYQAGYEQYFDAIASSGTLEEVYRKIDRVELLKASNAGEEVSTQIVWECE